MTRRLFYVNILLFLGVALLAAPHRRELRWALDALPRYLDGSIATPEERTLYREAAQSVGEEDWKLAHACEVAERSLAIDPNGEAGYWLARCLFESGQPDRALEEYRRYGKIDPVKIEPYLMQSAILLQRAEFDAAREVLERGLEFYAGNSERYQPVFDASVPRAFNAKAEWVADYYRRSARTLEREIRRVREAAAAASE